MLVLRHRLAIAGVIAAAAIAVPVAALASAPGSPPTKPGPPAAAAPSAGKTPPPGAQAPPDGAAAASKKAAAASQPDVAAPGASKTPPPGKQADLPAPVAAFIARLGVGTDAGGRAFKEVYGLVKQGGTADPASPAFAAIAREAGVSPDRLAAAWNSVSQDLAAAGL
jgi:hypothetical protein